MIRVEGLGVVFGRTVALDAIDVDLAPGVIGLFGANGSGKSTLLRVIAGLQRATSGRVLLDGRPIDRRSEKTRRLIGYAGHEPGLYRDLSVRENLALFARLYGLRSERIDEVLDALALREHASVPAGLLSAGLSRRAATARALLHEPRVLLLDEPYANLDDDASARLSEAVAAGRGPNRVAIIATHGAKKVKAFADGGVILRDGRVQVAGTYRRPAAAGAGS